jgi:uncharacterized protein YecT (DUF1311 family)
MDHATDNMKTYGSLLVAAFWTLAALGLGPAAVWATDNACEDALTTAQMQECANRRYARADAELNQAYKQLASQLEPQRRGLLRDAQRAWVAFRDKNAAFVASDAEGGTLYPVLEVSERASMTERRAQDLKARVQQLHPTP